MKKLLIALSLLISVQLGAQTKDIADALNALGKSKKEVENAKKAAAPATWIKLATVYANLYEAPVKTLWVGASAMELKVLLAGHRVVTSEEKIVGGQMMTVDTYADKILYFDETGALVAWQAASSQIPANTLQEAIKALDKAVEVDTKNQKTKDIVEQLDRIKSLYTNDALSANTVGDFAKASLNFENAFNLSNHKMINSTDTVLAYYTGLTASFSGDHDRTIKFIETALNNGYDADGDAYSFLADAYKDKSDIAKAKDVLNAGFQKYPSNQSILISLINTYIESHDDPEKVLELVRVAQRNEANNPSLYYAEGEVWKSLDKMDEALKCYEKSTQIDPNYVFGYYATGAAYYDRAVDIQRKASEELDDNKYNDMIKDMEASLESAISPLEKGFAISNDPEVQGVIAEYLKNIYFRFREKSPEYTTAYEKYNAIVTGVE